MTQSEFIKNYVKNSKISEEELNIMGMFAMPCDCGDDDCPGWQMTTLNLEKTRINHDSNTIN